MRIDEPREVVDELDESGHGQGGVDLSSRPELGAVDEDRLHRTAAPRRPSQGSFVVLRLLAPRQGQPMASDHPEAIDVRGEIAASAHHEGVA